MSATVATPGQTILIDGRRLGGGHADFVDAHGEVAGSADVIGGRRVATFGVPRDLAPGRYRLRLTNERGLDVSCSPLRRSTSAPPGRDSSSPCVAEPCARGSGSPIRG